MSMELLLPSGRISRIILRTKVTKEKIDTLIPLPEEVTNGTPDS